jgi:hypothetical protein
LDELDISAEWSLTMTRFCSRLLDACVFIKRAKKRYAALFDRADRHSDPVQVYLATITQSGGDAVDCKVNGCDCPLVRISRAIPFQQLDLYMIEWIDVGKSVTYISL